MEIRISEIDGEGGGKVTYGFVVCGVKKGREKPCKEACGKGIDEKSVVVGMDELLTTVRK